MRVRGGNLDLQGGIVLAWRQRGLHVLCPVG